MNYKKDKSNTIKNDFGYCAYSFEYTKDNVLDYVHIHNLYISNNSRGKGKAKEILGLVISEIRRKGYFGAIRIVADPKENGIIKERLMSFYKGMGLEVFTFYGEP